MNISRMREGLALLYIDPTYFVPLMDFHVFQTEAISRKCAHSATMMDTVFVFKTNSFKR